MTDWCLRLFPPSQMRHESERTGNIPVFRKSLPQYGYRNRKARQNHHNKESNEGFEALELKGLKPKWVGKPPSSTARCGTCRYSPSSAAPTEGEFSVPQCQRFFTVRITYFSLKKRWHANVLFLCAVRIVEHQMYISGAQIDCRMKRRSESEVVSLMFNPRWIGWFS